jgi:hypothetical protein
MWSGSVGTSWRTRPDVEAGPFDLADEHPAIRLQGVLESPLTQLVEGGAAQIGEIRFDRRGLVQGFLPV